MLGGESFVGGINSLLHDSARFCAILRSKWFDLEGPNSCFKNRCHSNWSENDWSTDRARGERFAKAAVTVSDEKIKSESIKTNALENAVYIEKGSSTVGKCVNRSGTWYVH